jgi:hypothetical protein
MQARQRVQLYVVQVLDVLRAEMDQLGVCVLSAIAQLRDDKTLVVNSFGKFICVRTGYAGGESTSQIVIRRPLPDLVIQKTAMSGT